MYSINARSVTNKEVSIVKAMQDREVDIAAINELNTVNPPNIRGLTYFHARMGKKLRSRAIYIANKWRRYVTKVPEDEKAVNM